MSIKESKSAFFRQGGWMVVCTVAGGALMTAVHLVAGSIKPESEYAVFCTLLRIYLLMGIPAVGLQTVFAQQSAAALDDEHHRQLASTTRAVLGWTFIFWLLLALVAVAFSETIITSLQITNPAALWFTIGLGLASLWMPVLKGLLQGRQEFMGLGWVLILDGVGRFASVAFILLWLGGKAAGCMLGALLGQIISLAVAVRFTWPILIAPGAHFTWSPWLRRVFWLTLGAGTILVISNADVILVQTTFPKEINPLYMAGAIVGFALAQFTMPLAVVMFPKVARSAARAEPTDAMMLTLKASALLGGAAALACTLLPELPLRIIYFRNPAYFLQAAPLVPWFAWCLLIVSLANVLVGNLLARERFAVVPWLVLLGAGYVTTLLYLRPSLLQQAGLSAFQTIIQVLGGFSLLLLAISIWFTWGRKEK